MSDKGRISALYRYPVKGLSPERLERAALEPGGTMPWDRAFAIENGSADFDPANPQHFPKIKFLMLMRHERLAALKTRFEDDGAILHIERDGGKVLRAPLLTEEGRAEAERFFAGYMQDRPDGRSLRPCAGLHPFRRARAPYFHHQSGKRARAGRGDRPSGRSIALSRQCLSGRAGALGRP